MSFKVIKVGTNRETVCDLLLVINSNWHPLVPFRSYRSLFFKFRTLFVFEPPLGWGAFDNVRCSSWTHWKARSGLPISVNWMFFHKVLRLSRYEWRDRKSAISLQRGHF